MEALKHLLNKESMSKSFVADSQATNFFSIFERLAKLDGLDGTKVENDLGFKNKFQQFSTTRYKDTQMSNGLSKTLSENALFSMQQILKAIGECHEQTPVSIQHSTSFAEIIKNQFFSVGSNITLFGGLILNTQKYPLNSKININSNKTPSSQKSDNEIFQEPTVTEEDPVVKFTNGFQENDADSETESVNDHYNDDDDDDDDVIWDDWDDDDDDRYISVSDCVNIPPICQTLAAPLEENFSDTTNRSNCSFNPFSLNQNDQSLSPPSLSDNFCGLNDWNSGIEEEIKNFQYESPPFQPDDILIIMHSGKEEENEQSSRVSEANSHWSKHYSSPIPDQPKPPKVRFEESELKFVHIYDDGGVDRKGPWEELARDSSRFKRRILSLSSTLSPILHPDHRDKVLRYILSRQPASLENS